MQVPTAFPLLGEVTAPAETTASMETPPSSSQATLFACWAIVIVLICMMVIFMRARKKEYALAVLPLAMVPFIHIFSGILARFFSGFLPFSIAELRVFIDLGVALVSCLLLGFTTRAVPEKMNRRLLMVFCSAFIIILTWVLIFDTLSKVLS